MRKGDKISREMFEEAIIACSGNMAEMVKHLDLNSKSNVQYLLDNKFRDLKDLWLSVKNGLVTIESKLDSEVSAFDSNLPPILTRIQIEIMEFIDSAGGDSVR